MANAVQSIPLDKLAAHPDNPNRMSAANFARLVRNIERTGRYEPLVVRPLPGREGFFQIINGHHRRDAIAKLGHKQADCIVWNIDDGETDILLATLNRLCGSDVLDKKLKLLRRLCEKSTAGELAKLLPQTKKQIERLVNLKLPKATAKPPTGFANAAVFFLSDSQLAIVEQALSILEPDHAGTTAHRRAVALAEIAGWFVANRTYSG